MSWRELAKGLMDWHEYMFIESEDQKKLDAIQRQHVSDEARLKAVLEAFLLGEGEHQPSWRVLIHALYELDKSHLAEKIKTNAEPHQGESQSGCVEREIIKLTHVCTLVSLLESGCIVVD